MNNLDKLRKLITEEPFLLRAAQTAIVTSQSDPKCVRPCHRFMEMVEYHAEQGDIRNFHQIRRVIFDLISEEDSEDVEAFAFMKQIDALLRSFLH